jgi:hypothetical protein
MFEVSFLLLGGHFVMLHPLSWLSCNVFHFDFAKVRFKMISFMLFNSMNFFCKSKCWCHNHSATHNIVTSFINDLFQMNSYLPSCFHRGLVLLFKRIITINEKCEMQCFHFFSTHNFKEIMGNAVSSWEYCFVIYIYTMKYFNTTSCKYI